MAQKILFGSEQLAMVLVPLVRFCLRHAFPLQEIVSTLKVVYVKATIEEMRAAGEKVNMSRVSMRTGVHVKDVKRIVHDGTALHRPESPLRKVIGQWEQDPRFLTKSRKPRVLPQSKGEHSFSDLVQSVSKSLHPPLVLRELQRGGYVQITQKGVRLVDPYHRTTADSGELLGILVADTEDLMLAVEENIAEADTIENLHVRTSYDNIHQESIPKVRRWILIEGSKFHKRIRDFLSKHDKDLNPQLKGEGGAKIVVGSFSRTEH